jgi:predicted metalloprotease with PDZ domain
MPRHDEVRTVSVCCPVAFLARSAVVAVVILTALSAAAQTDLFKEEPLSPATPTAPTAPIKTPAGPTTAEPELSPTIASPVPAAVPPTAVTPTAAMPATPSPDVGIPPSVYGHLGITVIELSNGDGLRVVGIERTSPAYPAGLLIDDEISTINGTRIAKFADLVNGLRTAGNGDGNVSLLVRRRGTLDTINLVVPGRIAQAETPKLGVMLDDSNGRLRVTGVVPGSPAAKAGIQVGDEIITVNDYPISTYDLFVGQIQAVGRSPGEPVAIGIRRNGQSMTVHAVLGQAKLPALPKSELPPTGPLNTPSTSPALPQ